MVVGETTACRVAGRSDQEANERKRRGDGDSKRDKKVRRDGKRCEEETSCPQSPKIEVNVILSIYWGKEFRIQLPSKLHNLTSNILHNMFDTSNLGNIIVILR